MIRSDLDRLRDARDFARYAQNDAGGLESDVLAGAGQPLRAALYDLAIMGETLNKVSGEIKSAAPDLPWRPLADLRNFIVHAYWQVDLEVVAEVIENRLDPIIAELDRLINFVARTEK
jgi:uncharacterized protein with HEPN domain